MLWKLSPAAGRSSPLSPILASTAATPSLSNVMLKCSIHQQPLTLPSTGAWSPISSIAPNSSLHMLSIHLGVLILARPPLQTLLQLPACLSCP